MRRYCMENAITLMVIIIAVILSIVILIMTKHFNERKNKEHIIDPIIYSSDTKKSINCKINCKIDNLKIEKIQSVTLHNIDTGEIICELNKIREVSVK